MPRTLTMIFLILTPALSAACAPPPGDAPAGADADLSAIILSSGTLVPEFDPGTTAYAVGLDYSHGQITVTGTPAAVDAVVAYSPGAAVALPVGDTEIRITVTSGDGTVSRVYAVTVTRADYYLSPHLGELFAVPAGSFQRDTDADDVSIVTRAFRMGRHEVTRAQFQQVMGADPGEASTASGPNDPVQQVNWYQAVAFCNKLSLREGLTPAYAVTVGGAAVDFSTLTFGEIPTTDDADWNAAVADWNADGYRLPTEMEWLWAAFGADAAAPGAVNTTGHEKRYAGDAGEPVSRLGEYAWYSGNSGGFTHPVGEKLANEPGLSDLSGNVWEWCWDGNGAWPAGELTDYRGTSPGAGRIRCGGSRASAPDTCDFSQRYGTPASEQNNLIGLRVIRP